MARVLTKEESWQRRKAMYAQKREEAFDLFVALDHELKHVFTNREIALRIGVEPSTVRDWRDEEKWVDKLEGAIAKAKERASNTKEMKSLLTTYLYGNKIVDEVGKDPAKVISKYERLKKRRLSRTIRHISDIIYEIREYNHRMFKMLIPREDNKVSIEVLKNREIIHKAWLDTTEKLLEIFGVVTIKELAVEALADTVLAQQLASKPEEKQAGVNITINQRKSDEIDIINKSNIIMDDGSHELIMKLMAEGAKINGPVGYIGPKEKGFGGEVEDAIITDKGGADKEGEE